MSPTPKAKKQAIIQYHKGGKGRTEISRLVGCSLNAVDRAIEDHVTRAPRRVSPYYCDACRATVYLEPCPACKLWRAK